MFNMFQYLVVLFGGELEIVKSKKYYDNLENFKQQFKFKKEICKVDVYLTQDNGEHYEYMGKVCMARPTLTYRQNPDKLQKILKSQMFLFLEDI